MADLIPPMLIKLQADVEGLKAGLAQAENAIKGVDKSVQQASTGMTNFVGRIKQVGASLGIAFAGTQVLQFGRDVIQMAQEAEAQQQRLYQLMKVGTGATDEQIASLNAQAEALEKVGVVTGGNITQTQSQLATFNLQTDTIKALTPAILDYVTAEKGATASADEFKQMTNGLAQALNGNFGSLTRVGFVLDENTKKQISSGTEAQRAAAIVEVLNSTYKDFNAELRNTPEGRMQVLRNDFDALKTDLGKKLLPALKIVTDFLTDQLIPGLRALGKFFKDNSTIILTVTGAVIAGVVAWKAYQTILVITTTVTKVYTAVLTVMRTGTLVSIASTNGLAASMLKLNAVMRANPIGVIVTAIALLAAGFVIAYKKSETFRNVVATVAKAILGYVAFMIRAWGEMITIIMKVITGPMRLFLGVMSKLPGVGDAAKAGLKLVNGAIEGVGNFAEKTANKVEGLKAKVDSFTAAANKAAKNDTTKKDEKGGGGTGGGGSGGLTDEQKKKLEKYKKDVAGIYKDMNRVISDAQEKAQEALENRNEKMFDAHKKYDERVADLKKDYQERMDSVQKNYDEKTVDIQQRRDKAELQATKRHAQAIEQINKDYFKKTIDLTNSYNAKLSDIRVSAQKKSADLTKQAAEKEMSIVQQSIDRLRNAFASKTGFSLADAITGGADSADKLIEDLKKKLGSARDLQASAAALAGMGYSQVFIEEVVKQGPEAGVKIANALKAATPEATKELQALYGEVENVSANGLNSLARTMNAGGVLATEELMNAFSQVSIDLRAALDNVNQEMNASLAEANAAYNEAMAEAKAMRDEKLADADTALQEALAEAKAHFDESMAEALKTLTEAREQAQKDLNEGLGEAQKTLAETLEEVQKDYQKSIDDINKATERKLADLREKLNEVIALIAAISAAQARAAFAAAPSFSPILGGNLPGGSVNTTTLAGINAASGVNPGNNPTTVISTTVNTTNLTSPQQVAAAVVSQIQFGQVVTSSGGTYIERPNGQALIAL
jgi:hypothetical protein